MCGKRRNGNSKRGDHASCVHCNHLKHHYVLCEVFVVLDQKSWHNMPTVSVPGTAAHVKTFSMRHFFNFETIITRLNLAPLTLDVHCLSRAVLNVSPIGTADAQAADVAAVGTCLLTSCQTQLAKCIGDFNCLQDLICLQGCQGKPDEQACEIRYVCIPL